MQHREAKDTLTPVEMDCGETLSFRLRNGETRTLALESASAAVLLTNLKDTRREERGGGTIYRFTCQVRVDGHPMTMERYVCSQESFCEPCVVNGMRVWFDAVSDIFDFVTEDHGACRPGKRARFAVNDARDPICPQETVPWCPLDGDTIDIASCYNGDDCWMGPYMGASAHGGLDINHPKGTPLHAPIDFDDQFYFNSVAAGDNNNRWRAIRRWPNGAVWTLQSHHMTRLLVPERTPLKAGTHYAEAAGVCRGDHEHSHFVFKVAEGGSEILLDPWILFWQMFETRKDKAGAIKAAMAPLSPVRTGAPVCFRSEGSRRGPGGTGLLCCWTFGDGSGSLDPNSTHTYMRPGIYPVTLTVDDGVGRAACTQHVTVDGDASVSPALALESLGEISFRPRPVHALDTYGKPIKRVPRTLDFVATRGRPRPRAKRVALINAGGGALPEAEVRLDTGETPGWLLVAKWAAEGRQCVGVQAVADGLAPGRYAASVRIECPGAANSPQEFRVLLRVIGEELPSQSVVGTNDEGFDCTPYFWVGPRFCGWPVGHGGGYLANGGRAVEGESARFTPFLRAGRYEVSLSDRTPFAPGVRFPVRVRHAEGEDIGWVVPEESPVVGTFRFDDGAEGFVEILAAGSSGQVLADAMCFRKTD